jgi:tRNA uridine 5-carboxymethylaminomethyl modification enzyme
MDQLSRARTAASVTSLSPSAAIGHGLHLNQDGVRRSLYEILGHSSVDPEIIFGLDPTLAQLPAPVRTQLTVEARYAPYLARQATDAERLRRDEAIAIPDSIAYAGMGGLSAELRAKLERIRPVSLAQAARIEGMTPVALNQILLHLRSAGA